MPHTVELLPAMYQRPNPKMPNWSNIISHIPPSFSDELLPFAQIHDAVCHKLAFADYHYHILNQLYRPHETERENATDSWARAEMHSIVFNLYSALESLAYEINLAYNLGIKQRDLALYHNHVKFTPGCFRCELLAIDPLVSRHVEGALMQSWFENFNHLRNQIAHKNLPIIHVYVSANDNRTHIMIPDDPLKTHIKSMNDYSKQLEINSYCNEMRDKVLGIIESTYALIEPIAIQFIAATIANSGSKK